MRQLTLQRRVDPWPTNRDPHHDEAPHLLPVLTRLAEQLLIARARGEHARQRALCANDLSPFGLVLEELRPLVASGLVEAYPAQGAQLPGRRKGSPARGLSGHPGHLGRATRLILTDAGLAYVTRHSRSLSVPSGAAAAVNGDASISFSAPQPPGPSGILPHYDLEARELHVAGVVILGLPVQARNLATVLTALQLSGWNRRVAKPLRDSPGGNDRHHLANVALRLNRHQHLIDFRTDDGAICWNWRPCRRIRENSGRAAETARLVTGT